MDILLNDLVGRGYCVLPVGADKKPLVGSWKEYQRRRPSPQEMSQWETMNPPAWATVTGAISGIITLDFDGMAGFNTMLELRLNPHRRTGSGGFHVDFEHPGWHVPTINSKAKAELGRRYPGTDVRADGGYVIVLGRNAKGAYEWWREPDPDSLILLPDGLRDLVGLLKPPANGSSPAAPPGWVARGDSALQELSVDGLVNLAVDRSKLDGRNNAGFWLACQLRDNGLSEVEAERIMSWYAHRVPRFNPKGDEYTKVEATATLHSAYSRPPRKPLHAGLASASAPETTSATHVSSPAPTPKSRLVPPVPLVMVVLAPASAASSPPRPNLLQYELNDTANALRLKEMYGTDMRYCAEFRRWLIYDGNHWERDRRGQAVEWTKAAMEEFQLQALLAAADPSDDTAIRFANRSLNRRNIDDLLKLAESVLVINSEQLDADPYRLNVANGTLDLRSFELRPHRREDFITKFVPIPYNPDACCPAFLKFLMRIMGGPGEQADRLIHYLQKALGMCLTGDVSEKVVFCMFGAGNNGKTTLLEGIRSVLGPYAAQVLIGSLLAHGERESNNAMADIADLRGARFVTTSEVGEGQHLDEGKLKYLSAGMGMIKTCRKYENPIQFQVTHKLFMDANHRPVVSGGDDAIWNRLKCIPFTVVIPPEEIDAHLLEKLKAEGEGILAWLVQGCWLWQREGLGDPPEVTEAGTEWRSEMDPMGDFLEDMCILDPAMECSAKVLRSAYNQWGRDMGHKFTVSPRKFNERLRKLGCVGSTHRFAAGYPERSWKGITLRVNLRVV